MRFVFESDVEEFMARVCPLLETRLECNVMATVLEGVRAGLYEEWVLAYGLDGTGAVASAAIRTLPYSMLVAPLAAADAMELVSGWLRRDPGLSGVSGPPSSARSVAAAWSDQTGGETSRIMRQAMHALSEVRDPERPAPGAPRQPRTSEHALVREWMNEFQRESGLRHPPMSQSRVTARIVRGDLWVWDDCGPVSLAGRAGQVAGVGRIGPVYTPPANRGRGYATSAVAALSRRVLSEGAHTCMLYTDLANPTSNKIYAEIGYRRFDEWEDHAFRRAG